MKIIDELIDWNKQKRRLHERVSKDFVEQEETTTTNHIDGSYKVGEENIIKDFLFVFHYIRFHIRTDSFRRYYQREESTMVLTHIILSMKFTSLKNNFDLFSSLISSRLPIHFKQSFTNEMICYFYC